MVARCELCEGDGGEVLFRGLQYRVVRVGGAEGAHYPGFCRVIWNAHVKEMSDLDAAERALLMDAVMCVEAALRARLKPEKINLASFGNMTPHLHWHVIPRYRGDASFPRPIWAAELAQAPQIDKLAPKGIPDGNAHAEWADAVRSALQGHAGA